MGAKLIGLKVEEVEEDKEDKEDKDEETAEDKTEGLHPAEIAARFKGEEEGKTIGGSDEQILKDLRKAVFSVPLLPQEEVFKLFEEMDSIVYPAVYDILEISETYMEQILQIVIKVAAGNTYGKNIYEKEDNPDPENPETKTTYKDHEVSFLLDAYGLFRNKDKNRDIKGHLEKCKFIRGVYEDVLEDFVNNTSEYEELHWEAMRAKEEKDHNEYSRITSKIKMVEKVLKMSPARSFSIVRDVHKVYHRYTDIRSIIIKPYLRKVYSRAKKTATNAHQMLENFQNGSMGLIRTVSCYSIKRQASFASVAKWWIKQMMLLSIKESANFVKLPVSTWQAYTQLEKAKAKLNAKDESSMAKIAKMAKVSEKKAKQIYATVKIAQVYSLNKTYDAEEKLTLEDVVTNEDRLGSEVDKFADLLRDYCDAASLSQREMQVIALNHGMPDLIKVRPIGANKVIQETLIQNLANVGYDFRPATKA